MGGPAMQGTKRASWQDRALVGRDELVAELTDLAVAAAEGTGALVLLTGEAGIGKTTVARAATRRAPQGVRVAWGNCTADRSAPPFWPWRDVIDIDFDIGIDMGIGADTRVAGRPPGADDGIPSDPAIGAARFERLRQLHGQLLAQDTPLVLVIEDLQWADVASVLLLEHVAAAITEAPLLIVGTLRTGEPFGCQLDEALEQVRRLAAVRALPPLPDEAIEALVREAGGGPDPELTALVRDRTGGNALFVTELLRAARASGSTDPLRDLVAGSVPARVAELIAHRLERLPDAVTDLVLTASVLGPEGDARTLAGVQGASVEATVELLEQARAARLLDAAPTGRWQFRHELVRDAVGATMTDATRARKHAVVLEALAATGAAPPPALARHALAALPLFDAERAVALAARAGESAFAQQAYEEAIGWFGQALAAAPADLAPRWRAELHVLRGEALRHIGELGDARAELLAAADLTDEPALLARAALGYADPGADLGIAYRTDDPVTEPLLERAIAAQRDRESPTCVLLEARLSAELYFSDQPGRARELAVSARDRAERLGDPRALGAAGAIVHDAFVVGQADLADQLRGSEQLLDWARAAGSAGALLTAHRARVFDLLAAGDLSQVDAEILAFRRVAEPLRAPGYLWWLSLWSAMRALLEGRLDLAEERALEAYAIGEGPLTSLAFINLSFLLFFLRREQGRFAEMEQGTRAYAASHADIPALRVSLMFLLAETGRTDEARAMLDALTDRDLVRLRDRNWPASWFQLARAAALVGDERLAAKLLDERTRPTERCVMVSLATVCLGSADLATAWLLHTVGDLDAAAARYAVAEQVNAAIGARSWLAHARADHARMLLDRGHEGDGVEARRLLDLAAATAHAIGLGSLAPQLAVLRTRCEQATVPAPIEGRQPAPVSAAPDAEDADGASSVDGDATFRRSGGVWQLGFGGRTAQLPHTRGLVDLAFLLQRPDQAVSVLELSGDRPAPATSRGAPALDERARREIRDRLRELDAEVDEAEAFHDEARAAAAREQRQRLAEAVARDLGLGGRARRVDDPVERARKTVSTRIRRAIASVGRVHPELGRHLERSIDTGTWCAYRPPEPITWTT